jgi:PBSX family phage terminase large subunit
VRLPICVGVDKLGKPRLYTPEAQQIAFHKSPAKFRAFFGGYGCGKTIASCVEALKTMLKFPGSEGLIGRYTDRELKQTTWKEFIDIIPPQLIRENNKAQLRLTLVNGAVAYGMHLQDEDKLRSFNLDWAMIDEGCEVGEHIWNQLIARLRGTTKDRDGNECRRIWLVGNPEGHNWIYKRFVVPWIEGNEKAGHAYFQGRSTDVGFLPPDYIASMYDMYDTDLVERYIQGSWEVFQGQVYPMFERSIHVLPADFKINPQWPKYRMVDHGWSDPCACIWGALDFDGNHYIYDCYGRKLTTIEDNTKAILERSGNDKFVYSILAPFSDKTEPGKGKKISELYREAGLHLVEQRSRVMAGVARVRELMQPREGRRHPGNKNAESAPKMYVLSHCKPVIQEFQAYRFAPVVDMNSPEKPLDRDNHFMDAVRAWVMFNPNAEVEPEKDDWEAYFEHLEEKFDPSNSPALPGSDYVIGNERAFRR